jgi:hypothetical protein
MKTYFCVVTTKTKTEVDADIVGYGGVGDDEELPEHKILVKGKVVYFNDWFATLAEAEDFKRLQMGKRDFITP